MPTAPGTIDLGELAPEQPHGIDVAPPIRERLRRLGAGRLRAALVAVLVGLVGTTVGGAAAGPEPSLALRFTVPATSFTVDQDNLYVVDASAPAGTLAAYRLDSGTRLWRHSWTDPGLWLVTWGRLLLGITTSRSGGEHTSRLDPDTGRPLWIHEGRPVGLLGDRLLLERPLPNPRSREAAGPPYQVTAVDVETGHAAWTRALESWSAQTVPGGSPWVMTVTGHGSPVSYDLSTGQPVRHGVTWIGLLRPDLSGVEVPGTADLGGLRDPLEQGCELRVEHLACLARMAPGDGTRGEVSVWRVR